MASKAFKGLKAEESSKGENTKRRKLMTNSHNRIKEHNIKLPNLCVLLISIHINGHK